MNPISLKNKISIDPLVEIESSMINKLSDDFIKKQDEVFLASLQKHIPDVTPQTVSQYAHRFTVIESLRSAGTDGYPKTYWLDYGTPKAVMLIKLNKPELRGNTPDTMTFEQTYEVY